MASNQTLAVAFAVAALVAGIGVLLVRPAPGEPERLSGLFAGARLFQNAWVRVLVAIVCFVVGFLGAATSLGWL
jgi:hypothetical protein